MSAPHSRAPRNPFSAAHACRRLGRGGSLAPWRAGAAPRRVWAATLTLTLGMMVAVAAGFPSGLLAQSQEPEPAPSPTSAPAPEAEGTPAPAPTPVPAAEEGAADEKKATVQMKRVSSRETGVAMLVPTEWILARPQPPIVLIANSPDNRKSMVVLRESKEILGSPAVADYFALKLSKLSEAWKDMKADSSKAGTINGRQARFAQATATVTDPEGIDIPTKMFVMTVGGDEYFYLIVVSARVDEFDGEMDTFLNMLRAFEGP